MPRQKGFAFIGLLAIVVIIIITSTFLISRRHYNPRSIIVNYELCDLDRNGKCDTLDQLIFDKVVGECINEDNYNELADADHDGCVTENDEWLLFKQKAPKPTAAPNQ